MAAKRKASAMLMKQVKIMIVSVHQLRRNNDFVLDWIRLLNLNVQYEHNFVVNQIRENINVVDQKTN